MYYSAKQNGWKLPDSFEGYAFLSYESEPLPTKHLTAVEILQLRDDAWHTYFTNPSYLDLVQRKFGLQQRKNVEDLTKVKLRRRLLGHSNGNL